MVLVHVYEEAKLSVLRQVEAIHLKELTARAPHRLE